MSHHLKTVVIAFLFLAAFNTPIQGQTPAPEVVAQPGCAYEFGSDNFVWCVTANGNIVRLTSPRDFEHVAVGSVNEGYVVCTPDAGSYFDTAAAASGWAAPILAAEPTEDGVRITRTTLDGRFTLLQEIAGRHSSRTITIRATLTNNGGIVENVRLLRTADLDIDNTRGNDVFDRSADSAWARQHHAVSLSALNENVPHQTRVSLNLSPRNCGPAALAELPASGDLAVSVRYDLGHFEAGESKVVRFRYTVY